MNQTHVTILGAGAFGSALGQVLTENRHFVRFYDPILGDPTQSPQVPSDVTADLAASLTDAEFIVLAAPSQAVDQLLPQLPHELPLIVATKGLLTDAPFAKFSDYMVLSGPGFAADIKAHRQTWLTATNRRIKELFARDYLRFDFTSDRRGVLMCGALKNVYAILAGLLDLRPGAKLHTQFLTEVDGEMQALLAANQADPATVRLACGRGDLALTCAPPSRNYEFGQILRQNPHAQPHQTVEGVAALARIRQGDITVPDSATKLKHLLKLSLNWHQKEPHHDEP